MDARHIFYHPIRAVILSSLYPLIASAYTKDTKNSKWLLASLCKKIGHSNGGHIITRAKLTPQ
jgi:hypothetical protein